MEDTIEFLDQGMVRIVFEKTNGTNNYRDALYFTQENYDATTPEQIEAMKQERFDNWVAVITYVAPEEPVVETPPAPTINIAGVSYALLVGEPQAEMSLIEVNSHWYYKV